MKKYVVLGIFSIMSGLAVNLHILEEWLFVVYFIPPPIETTLGLFIIFSILVIAGIAILFKKVFAAIIYQVFIFLLIIDRTIMFVFYGDYVGSQALIVPLAIGAIVFYLSKDKELYQSFK